MCPLAVMWYNLFSIGCLYIENYFFFMYSTFFTLPRIYLYIWKVSFCDARRLTLHVSHFILLFYTQNDKGHILSQVAQTALQICSGLFCH